MKSESDLEIYSASIVRFFSYILLFPFGLTFYPLLIKGSPVEIIVFFLSFILIFGLIIFNNKNPFIIIKDKNISVRTSYRHINENIPFSSIEKYKSKGNNRITLYIQEERGKSYIPLSLILDRNDKGLLVSILNERQIFEETKERQ